MRKIRHEHRFPRLGIRQRSDFLLNGISHFVEIFCEQSDLVAAAGLCTLIVCAGRDLLCTFRQNPKRLHCPAQQQIQQDDCRDSDAEQDPEHPEREQPQPPRYRRKIGHLIEREQRAV